MISPLPYLIQLSSQISVFHASLLNSNIVGTGLTGFCHGHNKKADINSHHVILDLSPENHKTQQMQSFDFETHVYQACTFNWKIEIKLG